MYKDYQQVTAGARVVGDYPMTDGSTALEILNFTLDDRGLLDSTFRLMPFIPDEWRGAAQPAPLISGTYAIGFGFFESNVPEILILAARNNAASGAVWRFTPWNRGAGGTQPGLTEQQFYPDFGGTVQSVRPQRDPTYPPQIVHIGNRFYMTFCDGGGMWVADRRRLRQLGFPVTPQGPMAYGPARAGSEPNGGGFTVRGRIGDLADDWTDPAPDSNEVTGGLMAGRWIYAYVWENTDGAYSATSPVSGRCEIRNHTARSYGLPEPESPENWRRRFRLTSIAKGPPGTVAGILLRSANLKNLPPNDTGGLHFLHRIPNNLTVDWIDDIPDIELGPVWQDRMAMPNGVYFLAAFAGSLLFARTDGNPSRVWWSEQTAFGPRPESIIDGHWADVYPHTGPITGLLPVRPVTEDGAPACLVLKEEACHYLSGAYPTWGRGTLHARAGCAGPGCARVCPDGTAVWYGAGTFWRLDEESRVSDVGGPIRRWLDRVNSRLARYGVSWTDRKHGEVVFALPLDDATGNNFQFVWDYRLKGWRMRQDLENITAACELPGTDIVLVAGDYSKRTTVWVYGRGYPNFSVTNPTWSYTTGWAPIGGVHEPSNPRVVIFTQEERTDGSSGIAVYQDWDRDVSESTETIENSHPEDPHNTLVHYASDTDAPNMDTPALYGTSLWRTRRVFEQHVAAEAPSASVFCINITGQYAASFGGIDTYGPVQAPAGGRTPTPAP